MCFFSPNTDALTPFILMQHPIARPITWRMARQPPF